MEKVSAVVISYNEEKYIGPCLDSLKEVADEVIVLDSFSTDRTVDIARGKGARVVQQAFTGYRSQKNSALELASFDFVLSLDADECLSRQLIASILEEKKRFRYNIYRMNRCAFYCGKFIRSGTWYPEPKIRLFNRKSASWGGMDPHDRIVHAASEKTGKLRGDILHYICDTVEQHRERTENFSTLAASSLYDAGKQSNWLKILASPGWFFVFDYIVRGGFLNGWRGWKIATLQARYHFLKYLKLYRLRQPKG